MILAFFGCSREDIQTSQSGTDPATASAAFRTTDDPAANDANPFDRTGRVHDELFISYFAQPAPVFSIDNVAAQVEALALANAGFQDLEGAGDTRNAAANAQAWMGHETCGASDAVNASALGAMAKTSLADFTASLLAMNSSVTDYEVFYSFITEYEAAVLNNLQMTAGEKEFILTVTSIGRYSTYRGKKKPKKNTDPDWDMMVLSLAGGIDGAGQSPAASVVNALTAGIVQNQKP